VASIQEFSLATVFARNGKIEEAPLQNELMLFDPQNSRFFVLNGTMAFIWRNCDGARSAGQIVDGLIQEFAGVEASAARVDVRTAFGELISAGLVVDTGSGHP
jgi:hypothetical protein